MSEKVFQERVEKLQREHDQALEKLRVLEAEVEAAWKELGVSPEDRAVNDDPDVESLAGTIHWELQHAREREELLRAVLADVAALYRQAAEYFRKAALNPVTRDAWLGDGDMAYAKAVTAYVSVPAAPTATMRGWLPFEDAIIKHLFERIEQWRAAGCPPAQTYFTAGLERQVAKMIECDRLPMPSWLRQRLGSDEVFRTVFYKELVAVVQDSSPKLAALLLPQSDAVESDWPADGKGGCQGRSATGVKCGIQVKHTGTPHRFCRRQPHDGYCVEACFRDELGERPGEWRMPDAEKRENRVAETEASAADECARRNIEEQKP